MPEPMVPDHTRWALEYLLTTYEQSSISNRRSELRNNLYDHIKKHGTEDENGNLILTFDSPMTVDGEEYYDGLQLQRRVSEFINDDRAMEIIENHNLQERCLKKITTLHIDYDALYACNQEGLISDEDIDSILEQDESWALVKVKV